jgi:hypothetical protein
MPPAEVLLTPVSFPAEDQIRRAASTQARAHKNG